MKTHQLLNVVRAGSAAFVAVMCVVMSAIAQGQETLTATATVTSAGGAKASAPLTAVIDRFATDAERDALVAAVKSGGTTAARDLLAKRADAGSIQLGAKRTPIKYAYARSTGSGRLITLVTSEPVAFLGAGLPEAKPKAGYDLGLVLLEVNASGGGKGELAPAAKVRVDAQNAIVTEDYGAEVVHLSNVAKK
jgi:hypothetical protein